MLENPICIWPSLVALTGYTLILLCLSGGRTWFPDESSKVHLCHGHTIHGYLPVPTPTPEYRSSMSPKCNGPPTVHPTRMNSKHHYKLASALLCHLMYKSLKSVSVTRDGSFLWNLLPPIYSLHWVNKSWMIICGMYHKFSSTLSTNLNVGIFHPLHRKYLHNKREQSLSHLLIFFCHVFEIGY